MKQIHDYFYAVAAACVVAIGTGFLAVTDTHLDYERNAFAVVYEYDRLTGDVLSLESDCSSVDAEKALCRYAYRLLETNKTMLSLYEVILILLALVSFVCLIIGIHLHLTRTKES